jgi:TolA-binding protein
MTMRKKFFMLLLMMTGLSWMASLSCAESHAANEGLNQYLQTLQVKLGHAAQRANQPSAEGSNVVGIRGSKQEPAAKQLYWKGKTGKVAVSPDEITLFRSGVDQAAAGKKEDAIATLNSFEQKYPKSPLMPDVQETQRRLNTAPAK